MTDLHIVTVVGARPQFIKAAMVSAALDAAGVREDLIHTGQHFDDNMSAIFFHELGMNPPTADLGISGGSHGAMTGRMLAAVEEVLLETEPDGVLVYGDTNSTLAGALAAAKLNIPVGHVEAGLRSLNRAMPEETNRVLTDHIADLLFAPTTVAAENLAHEGIDPARVVLTGDVMYDAALRFGAEARASSTVLSDLGLQEKDFILATVHRAENTDDDHRLVTIFEGLMGAADDIDIVLPLHPRTARALDRVGLHSRTAHGLRIVEPLGYLEMLRLEQAAAVIATDSGGVQKEAFFYRVPCVTLRDETEWVELVDLGWNRLVPPTDSAAVTAGLLAARAEAPADDGASPYGEGDSAQRIVASVIETFAS